MVRRVWLGVRCGVGVGEYVDMLPRSEWVIWCVGCYSEFPCCACPKFGVFLGVLVGFGVWGLCAR